ncbi:acetate--CoA ligase [Rickettsiales endosymbiont of Stachyamoeba lipophora]|uniref:acetate--CoA ligase n=1 Tax=Rickettsiales endosymbiont of Stachyamoeba lipophora TaxID=2486578 RepID=UPI000F64C6C0|nr:acetate--CoA ligase [Rickettsiales endosymbiont of Stachyamoeba lipophora]AZL15018.1 acetate--CoA ligase [Rickettsiales endosymbiont of Stachyamoeba lipophora]
MQQSNVTAIHPSIRQNAHINEEQYHKLYEESVTNPEQFWATQAKNISWFKEFTIVKNTSFKQEELYIKWFEDGILNACFNCVDRHLPTKANQIAYIWEGDEPHQTKSITYQELFDHVNEFSLKLKKLGVKKGDIVVIYLPMILETVYAMLACARIGAVHSLIFAGFSSDSLRDRIRDTKAKLVITADGGKRGGKPLLLKDKVDLAVQECEEVEKVLLIKYLSHEVQMSAKDICYEDIKIDNNEICEPEAMNAEDPLFILYTSGSTNKPKGIVHTTGGYLVYASLTHKYIFDYKEGEIYWCTADLGWVTGHSYALYGPLCNAATTLIFEGVPSYPSYARTWEIVDKHKVNILYTAPTLIRTLKKEGDHLVQTSSRKSLRVLGSVGEPINPEAWKWFYDIVGESRCPIVDTWWQTETGGILITPLIGATPLKAGSATNPFFGITPILVDNEAQEVIGEGEGNLCIKDSWPGQARTILNDHNRFYETYFAPFEGYYFSGDGAKRDSDNYYWITGRVDDVINISGHRLGTAELESALVAHNYVAEAAAVGYPHEIKGQGIYIYVVLKPEIAPSDNIVDELKSWVRKIIGAIATPDIIQICADLPKTRSGKIMRRILRKIAEGEFEAIGDTSTLADPKVLEEIIKGKG